MNTNELIETIRDKNRLIIKQSRRISLLEDKMDELRKKYFQIKHSGYLIPLKTSI
jgi:hypothetical protein